MLRKNIIVAMTLDGVIGKDGKMPWHIPEDLKNFKKITDGNTLIMGENTWYSIPGTFRPFSNRENIVLSEKMDSEKGIKVCRTLEEALSYAEKIGNEIFFIGGGTVYKQTISLADRMYISFVKKRYKGDTFFPEFDESEWNIKILKEYNDFILKQYDKK